MTLALLKLLALCAIAVAAWWFVRTTRQAGAAHRRICAQHICILPDQADDEPACNSQIRCMVTPASFIREGERALERIRNTQAENRP